MLSLSSKEPALSVTTCSSTLPGEVRPLRQDRGCWLTAPGCRTGPTIALLRSDDLVLVALRQNRPLERLRYCAGIRRYLKATRARNTVGRRGCRE
ncbi:MAG: hypothetical protein Q9M35_06105 [Rhodothermus sp.]|nr:hypothetical protein [Rhodothermus sp.]